MGGCHSTDHASYHATCWISTLINTTLRVMMLVLRKFCFAATVLLLCSTAVAQSSVRLSDDELMTVVQKSTFEYFWDGAEKNSKWARERIHIDEPEIDETLITSGGTGFGSAVSIAVRIAKAAVNADSCAARPESPRFPARREPGSPAPAP